MALHVLSSPRSPLLTVNPDAPREAWRGQWLQSQFAPFQQMIIKRSWSKGHLHKSLHLVYFEPIFINFSSGVWSPGALDPTDKVEFRVRDTSLPQVCFMASGQMIHDRLATEIFFPSGSSPAYNYTVCKSTIFPWQSIGNASFSEAKVSILPRWWGLRANSKGNRSGAESKTVNVYWDANS